MQFGSITFKEGQENNLKKNVFNISIDPREWMAKNGHRILSGDMRRYKYSDKEFEKWIFTAYKALSEEGLENLWKEFLSPEEISIVKDQYENW